MLSQPPHCSFACGLFIGLQKAFITVNHDILLSKLNHYSIRGVAFDWVKQENSVNTTYTYGALKGSIIRSLLFLISINDISQPIKISKAHHFANDTNLLYTSNSLREINKNTNFDLSHLVKLLRANKIALNVNKTDIAIIWSPTK